MQFTKPLHRSTVVIVALGLGLATFAVLLLRTAPQAAAAAANNGDKSETGHADDVGHGGLPANRLAGELSPYLQLHAHNPVDWYPWGEEALAKARSEDKPIFLSVGYSTCYWCHVMERESFSDPTVAAFMNEHFVNIKVDREERPDLDEIYMLATQLMTRRGGWPNSVFLTPELEPFFTGTYFPPRDMQGRPGFQTVLTGLHRAWTESRPEVEAQASQLAQNMRRIMGSGGSSTGRSGSSVDPPALAAGEAEALAASIRDALAARFDQEYGGFGAAPKFPSPSNLLLLLDLPDDAEANTMLNTTLDHMARGGMYDQVGGGFHRYSTDGKWLVPHFEKMLYDNGSLLEVYARWYERTADPQSARVLRQTAEFIAREMTADDGGLLSAIDAETDAREGAFYVWTRDELEAALVPKDHAWASPILGFAGPAFFRDPHGSPDDEPTYVLHVPSPFEPEHGDHLDKVRATLLKVRAERKRPLTDDKWLTDWNGLGIAGLAEAGRVLDDAAIIAQARLAAEAVLGRMTVPDRPLQHTWRAGTARLDAFNADYAYLIHGLLTLHRATDEKRWLKVATRLQDEHVGRLWDETSGGFFAAAKNDDLLLRSKDASDGARPSPNGVAVLNLLRLFEETGERRFWQRATAAIAAFAPQLRQQSQSMTTLTRASLRYQRSAAVSPVEDLEALARSRVNASLSIDDGVIVHLEIADGWHINANPASDEFLIPTEIRAVEGALSDIVYPPSEVLAAAFSQTPLAVYSGSVEIRAHRSDASDAIELVYQACDDQRCLPAVTTRLNSAGVR